MKPRSRYIAHSTSLTQERRSWRARCSARRSRRGSNDSGAATVPWRRALRRASVGGPATNAASAVVIRPAVSNTSIAGSASGRPREEDDSLRLGRDVAEVAHHLGLAAPAAGTLGRDGGPHSLVELATELVDQQLLVLAHLEITLR